ncbi:hypothetical protein V6N12_073407 [Hibiscus sabdariffa]|uniref:Large ribosomal subunit protein uL23m n=1 Tax=Hibiscus sabdariffa TaxID=183260 RepID=A0ABR1ZGI1_9ROSI
MLNTFTNIKEITLKTIPSASKIEIKRVLESLYGFNVDQVRTLNMEGKKKKRDDGINKTSKSKSVVEEGQKKKHWLDGKVKDDGQGKRKGKGSYASARSGGEAKFPWSNMRKAS